ncbi:hypothetical protein STRIP9103_05773, partial [Streptomyces ipomoeae 91-03]
PPRVRVCAYAMWSSSSSAL